MIRWIKNYLKRHMGLLAIGEICLKSTTSYCFMPMRYRKKKMSHNTKCRRRSGATLTHYGGNEHLAIQCKAEDATTPGYAPSRCLRMCPRRRVEGPSPTRTHASACH